MTEGPDNDRIAMARSIAATCNNAAWSLLERTELGPEKAADLLMLAATARYHWHEVGTASNTAHADMLYAWALARNGLGEAAVTLARASLSHFEESGALWERAFAHAALAAACHAQGQGDEHATHFASARTLGASLSEPDATYFQAAFATVPQPA